MSAFVASTCFLLSCKMVYDYSEYSNNRILMEIATEKNKEWLKDLNEMIEKKKRIGALEDKLKAKIEDSEQLLRKVKDEASKSPNPVRVHDAYFDWFNINKTPMLC